jgi:hypothetical protein
MILLCISGNARNVKTNSCTYFIARFSGLSLQGTSFYRGKRKAPLN